jgi:N-acetylglucosamine-6-phosphate deacetylase
VTVFAATRVANGEGGLSASPAWVVVEGGRVVATGIGAPPAGDVEDLGDALLAPGFLDLQVNGVGAIDFAVAGVDEIVDALDELAAQGCTGCLPTLITAPLDAYDGMLERVAAARRARPDAVLGIHLEGPFLGGAPGAHPVELLRAVDVEWLASLCERHGDLVHLVTLAPEADPDLLATKALRERGIVVSLGHTTIDYDGARAAADAGATMVTHLFNGMTALHHRRPGLPGAALSDRRLVPSIIADFVHVHPVVVRLALDARADLVLVSDAVAVSGNVRERDGAAYLPDGTLAGSILTMERAVQNIVSLGIPPARALRLATRNPARALGLDDRGRIAPGARADLVSLDPATLSVRRVWVGGHPIGR